MKNSQPVSSIKHKRDSIKSYDPDPILLNKGPSASVANSGSSTGASGSGGLNATNEAHFRLKQLKEKQQMRLHKEKLSHVQSRFRRHSSSQAHSAPTHHIHSYPHQQNKRRHSNITPTSMPLHLGAHSSRSLNHHMTQLHSEKSFQAHNYYHRKHLLHNQQDDIQEEANFTTSPDLHHASHQNNIQEEEFIMSDNEEFDSLAPLHRSNHKLRGEVHLAEDSDEPNMMTLSEFPRLSLPLSQLSPEQEHSFSPRFDDLSARDMAQQNYSSLSHHERSRSPVVSHANKKSSSKHNHRTHVSKKGRSSSQPSILSRAQPLKPIKKHPSTTSRTSSRPAPFRPKPKTTIPPASLLANQDIHDPTKLKTTLDLNPKSSSKPPHSRSSSRKGATGKQNNNSKKFKKKKKLHSTAAKLRRKGSFSTARDHKTHNIHHHKKHPSNFTRRPTSIASVRRRNSGPAHFPSRSNSRGGRQSAPMMSRAQAKSKNHQQLVKMRKELKREERERQILLQRIQEQERDHQLEMQIAIASTKQKAESQLQSVIDAYQHDDDLLYRIKRELQKRDEEKRKLQEELDNIRKREADILSARRRFEGPNLLVDSGKNSFSGSTGSGTEVGSTSEPSPKSRAISTETTSISAQVSPRQAVVASVQTLQSPPSPRDHTESTPLRRKSTSKLTENSIQHSQDDEDLSESPLEESPPTPEDESITNHNAVPDITHSPSSSTTDPPVDSTRKESGVASPELGEKQLTSILVVDILHIPDTIEQESLSLLKLYQNMCLDEIANHEGVLISSLGNAIVAVFEEQQIEECIHCAITMVTKVSDELNSAGRSYESQTITQNGGSGLTAPASPQRRVSTSPLLQSSHPPSQQTQIQLGVTICRGYLHRVMTGSPPQPSFIGKALQKANLLSMHLPVARYKLVMDENFFHKLRSRIGYTQRCMHVGNVRLLSQRMDLYSLTGSGLPNLQLPQFLWRSEAPDETEDSALSERTTSPSKKRFGLGTLARVFRLGASVSRDNK